MGDLLLFLVFAGLTAGLIALIFYLATRKGGAQPANVRRTSPGSDDFTPITTSNLTFTPSSGGEDTNLNPGGGSFGGGGADGGWTDTGSNATDSVNSDSSSSDSSSSDSGSSDSGSSSSDSSS